MGPNQFSRSPPPPVSPRPLEARKHKGSSTDALCFALQVWRWWCRETRDQCAKEKGDPAKGARVSQALRSNLAYSIWKQRTPSGGRREERNIVAARNHAWCFCAAPFEEERQKGSWSLQCSACDCRHTIVPSSLLLHW